MRHLITLLTTSTLLLTSCGPSGMGEGFSTKEIQAVKDMGPENTKPQVQKFDNLEIIMGSTKNVNLGVSYATTEQRMILRGELELTPAGSNKKPLVLPINLAGYPDKDGYVFLKEEQSSGTQVPGIKLGAKATCLGEKMNCATSFIDIYIEFEGRVYRHQLQSAPVVQPTKPGTGSSKDDVKNPPKPQAPTESDDHEHEEEEGDAGEESHYVGNPVDDVEKILGIKTVQQTPAPARPTAPVMPTPPVKNPPPKKDGGPAPIPKGEDPKIDAESPFSQTNQAIGSATKTGRLEKGVNMLTVQSSIRDPGFHILKAYPPNHFATSEMAYIIVQMGQLTKKLVPGSSLGIGDISAQNGGKLKGHQSHRNGLDVDVQYYVKDKSIVTRFAEAVAVLKADSKGNKRRVDPDWMVSEQWTMFKTLVQTQMVDRIFVDQVLKNAFCAAAIKSGELKKETNSLATETLRRLSHESGHANHFHLRLKCSSSQPRCLQMVEPAQGSGCF